MVKFCRSENIRKENKIIYIFTEGKKTEPLYFNSKKKEIEDNIRRISIKIEIQGTGRNTLSLVDFAIEYVGENNIDLSLDDCWLVFDKDSFDKNFDSAINKAQKNNFKVAYSNESFELWFLLHFSFMSSALTRSMYISKLTENLKLVSGDKNYKYSKTSDIYTLIKDKESDAIRNAKKLIDLHSNKKSFLEKNPSTSVYLLVEDLNKLKF